MSTSWVWTCRAGFEPDLAQELVRGVVREISFVEGAPPSEDSRPTFGRQGFPVAAHVHTDEEAVAATLALIPPRGSFALHVWVPDSDEGNLQSHRAVALREAILKAAGERAESEKSAHDLIHAHLPLIQVAVTASHGVYVGSLAVGLAASTWVGGRARMRVAASAPSRASMKLEEAFAWLGFGPEANDHCVDLGAAPGGWTWVLLQRGANVVAIDRANMKPELMRDKRMKHLRDNAFEYTPPRPVDWLVCDVVCKPNEIATVLARWGKRGHARYLVSNVKLPMKQRIPVVQEVVALLQKNGWKHIRTRQLYHDRDEITLAAWR